MNKTWTIKLSLVCILLSLMLVVSCGKKKVQTDPNADQTMTTDATATDDSMASDTNMSTEEDVAMTDASQDDATNNADAMAQAEDDFVNTDIHFDYDSSVIMDSETATLESKADWLRANSGVSIVIEGHCDERGTTEYNLALGDRRAARVKSFLVNLGIDASRIKTISYGEERPVAMGHMESAWSKNRRAHFVIK